MNKLESTLKHNLEVAIENAMNCLLEPDKYTTTQRLDIRRQLYNIKLELICVDSFDKEDEGALNNFPGAYEDDLKIEPENPAFTDKETKDIWDNQIRNSQDYGRHNNKF